MDHLIANLCFMAHCIILQDGREEECTPVLGEVLTAMNVQV